MIKMFENYYSLNWKYIQRRVRNVGHIIEIALIPQEFL